MRISIKLVLMERLCINASSAYPRTADPACLWTNSFKKCGRTCAKKDLQNTEW